MKTKKSHIVLAVIAAAILGCFIAALLGTMDGAPPEDGDLAVTRFTVEHRDNAFTYLTQIPDSTAWPEAPESHIRGPDESRMPWAEVSEYTRIKRIIAGQAWDRELVVSLLERNREALALCDKALEAEYLQFPEPTGLWDRGYGIALQGALNLRGLVRLRRHLKLHDDGPVPALNEAMRLIRFGHRLEGAKGDLLAYSIGRNIKGQGLTSLREVLSQPHGEILPCGKIVDDLEGLSANTAGLADALRVEYQIGKRLVDKVARGEEPVGLKGLTGLVGSSSRFVFQPNDTKRMLADDYGSVIGDLARPYAAMRPRKDPEYRPWRLYLPGNPVGRSCARLMAPFSEAGRLKCRENVEVAGTRLLIAARAFAADSGRLPEDLADLVPRYIGSVPADDYDGRPMRYNPGKKVIYSVGEDLKDEGGMSRQEGEAWWYEGKDGVSGGPVDPTQLPDPSFPVDF